MAKTFKSIVQTAFGMIAVPGMAVASEGGGLPQLNPSSFPSQIFWLAVTFAILFILMWKVALPRVGDTLSKREQKVSSDLQKAEKLQADAEKAQDDLEKALAESRSKAQAILSKASEEVAAEQAKRLDAFDADMATKAEEAQARIEAAREQALKSVHDVALEVTQASVEKLIGQPVDEATVKKAIDAAAKN